MALPAEKAGAARVAAKQNVTNRCGEKPRQPEP